MATKSKSKSRSATRTHSKESYRLWFEFLKRAIAKDKRIVKLSLYKSWGDVENLSFNKWWIQIGSNVINLDSVSKLGFATDTLTDDSSYLVRVPKSLTSTQAATQLRELLTSSKHKPKIDKTDLRVTEGVELRHSIYRAYLHTYDRHKELVDKNNGVRVTNKETLIAVRKFYLARHEKYKNHNRKVENLPPQLWDALKLDDLDDVDVLASATSLATIGRYLREANKILNAVALGKFPK
jgi:hypothetical protein